MHPLCPIHNYEFVTTISISDDAPDPDPTTPAPAVALVGPVLCDECRLFAPGYDDYCDDCQAACNDWDSDQYIEPDWGALYERYQSDRAYGVLAA